MPRSKSKPPPAPKGHRRSVKHGAKAQVLPARIEATARAIDKVLEEAPVRNPDGRVPIHDRGVIEMLAVVRCRLEDVGRWLDERGVMNPKTGKPQSAALWERRLQSQALRLEKELGMTPQARAKLGVNLARTADLAQAMSNPDPVKRAQQLRELGLGDSDE
ncbi:MAG TPA: P27 family phage terminase small subunit [Solirubrobacteraceae bacterium]|jgi:hypothetical protein|nr:P27 family phage terminase small subunit [Solirubrobacteraceae bacterium]